MEGVEEGRKIVGQADTADDEPIRYEVAGCTFESVFFNFVLENDLYFKKYFPKKDLGIHMMKVHHLQSFKLPYQEYQEDTPPLSNDHFVNEQDPVIVQQVWHVKSSLGRVNDEYAEMVDDVKVEQAPVEHVKVDVATE